MSDVFFVFPRTIDLSNTFNGIVVVDGNVYRSRDNHANILHLPEIISLNSNFGDVK